MWEENGWQGVDPDVAVRLASGGALFSTFWNVNAVMAWLAVDAGDVVRRFDPLFRAEDPGAGRPLPGEAALDWATSPRGSGLALLAAAAGTQPVDPSWLDGPDVRFWGHHF